MRTLVDTCVLSEIGRARGDARVRARLEAMPRADVHLSVVTLGELARGAALERTEERTEDRRARLEAWIRTIEDLHGDRILPVDARVARMWGTIDARCSAAGRTLPAADGMIAATALVHDLVVMTRNARHFEPTGVSIVDPWNA